MNKKVIIFIIVLMTFALAMLAGIEIYWIKNAISVKEANFDRNVKDAMTNVIFKLEKLEVAKRLRNKMYKNKQSSRLIRTIDSLNNVFSKEIENHKKDTSYRPPENIFNLTSEKINVVVLQEHTGEIIKRYDTSIITIQKKIDFDETNEIFSETPNYLFSQDTTMRKKLNNYDNRINKYLDQTLLVNEVFEDMFNLKQFDAIENRLDFALLDSLVSTELKRSGINTVYEYGVYSPLRNIMISEKTGQYHKFLLEKGFAFNLFPRDLFMAPEYLMIYFPEKQHFILSQLWKILIVSSILILVIVFSFTYTIFTIFRQKRLSEMKNDFINNMTHEFKTPVSTISIACEALRDNDIFKTEALQKNYINVINEENKRLGAMAEKILQTAILDKGDLKLHYEVFDLEDIIRDVIKRFELQISSKGGQIATEFLASDTTIKADKTHITNVIYNILDNANKYTPKNPLIKIKTTNDDKGIYIFVEDNGIGISKANQKKIFEKLYRVPTGNLHNVKGFGLGLHYVKTIVSQHKGLVWVESELKKGTRMKIFLPFES